MSNRCCQQPPGSQRNTPNPLSTELRPALNESRTTLVRSSNQLVDFVSNPSILACLWYLVLGGFFHLRCPNYIHDVSVRQSTPRSRLNAVRQARSKVNGRKMPPRGRIRSRSIEPALPVCLNTQNCNIPGEIFSQKPETDQSFLGTSPRTPTRALSLDPVVGLPSPEFM